MWSLEVPEDEVRQSCVYDNFCSTTRGLSTLKVSRNFAEPFLRKAGKGGGPLNFIEITLDPIIIAALDVRFWKLWRHIWIQLKNRYFLRLQRQRRQIHPIEIDNSIPMNQLQQAVAVE